MSLEGFKDAIVEWIWGLYNTAEIPPVPPETEPTPEVITVPVVRADQDAPTPDVSFISVDFLSFTKLGNVWKSLIKNTTVGGVEVDGVQQIRYDIEVPVQIDAFGSGGLDNLVTLIEALDLSSTEEYFRANKIVYRGTESMQETTALENDQSVQRWTLELLFGTAVLFEDIPGWIKVAEISQV